MLYSQHSRQTKTAPKNSAWALSVPGTKRATDLLLFPGWMYSVTGELLQPQCSPGRVFVRMPTPSGFELPCR